MACYELRYTADLLPATEMTFVQELVTRLGTFGTDDVLEYTRRALRCAGVIDSPTTRSDAEEQPDSIFSSGSGSTKVEDQ